MELGIPWSSVRCIRVLHREVLCRIFEGDFSSVAYDWSNLSISCFDGGGRPLLIHQVVSSEFYYNFEPAVTYVNGAVSQASAFAIQYTGDDVRA